MPSFDRPRQAETDISPWLRRFAHLLKPGGEVLDLAAGFGRHSRWLAARGYRVLSADIDISGIADLAESPAVEVLAADLETDDWPLAERRFDAVLVTNYLHRAHFPLLPGLLNEGGVLLFDTFSAGNEQLGRPRNPDFLLRPGELLDAFSGLLQVVAFEQGSEQKPRPAVRQRLCARRGEQVVALQAG